MWMQKRPDSGAIKAGNDVKVPGLIYARLNGYVVWLMAFGGDLDGPTGKVR
jgi:hypothetical protein